MPWAGTTAARQYCQTRARRYGEAINRLVRGLLKGITEGRGGPAGQHLATRILDRLRILHKRLGLAPRPSHRPVFHEWRDKRMKKCKAPQGGPGKAAYAE
jgi:hypothetical protein